MSPDRVYSGLSVFHLHLFMSHSDSNRLDLKPRAEESALNLLLHESMEKKDSFSSD